MKGAPRPRAELSVAGEAWDVFDAWRTAGGLGLAYFVRRDREGGDRRAVLEEGARLEAMDETELARLWESAVALTSTERRFLDAEGEVWLVQGTGPLWASGGSAADTTGVRARCVSAERPIAVRRGVGPDDVSDAELLERVAARERAEA